MMIGLGDVILDGTGLLTKSQPVTTRRAFTSIVFLHKDAITEVILVYDFNAREFLHEDAKFSREFSMGMPNSLFGGGYQNTEGGPKSLGDLTRGVPDPL